MGKLLSVLSLFLLFSCAERNVNVQFAAQPEKHLASHVNGLSQPITDRIAVVPPTILAALNKADSTDRYAAYLPSLSEKAMFQQYFILLPAAFQDVINRKVIAVYFIKNFLSGGMSDYVFDPDGAMYIALYLNPDTLSVPLDEWLTFRDASPFIPDAATKIVSTCGDHYFGLLHTLTHEACHIYDYYFRVTPFVERALADPSSQNRVTTFIMRTWRSIRLPEPSLDFDARSSISFYGLGKKIEAKRSIAMYRALARTPFSSLYASMSWAEDFAEGFTWYYLHRLLGLSYNVVIFQDGREIARFNPDGNPVVTARYLVYESILPR